MQEMSGEVHHLVDVKALREQEQPRGPSAWSGGLCSQPVISVLPTAGSDVPFPLHAQRPARSPVSQPGKLRCVGGGDAFRAAQCAGGIRTQSL